jgi:hypothetical protein
VRIRGSARGWPASPGEVVEGLLDEPAGAGRRRLMPLPAPPGRGRRLIRSGRDQRRSDQAGVCGAGGCDEAAVRCNDSHTRPGSAADAARRRAPRSPRERVTASIVAACACGTAVGSPLAAHKLPDWETQHRNRLPQDYENL